MRSADHENSYLITKVFAFFRSLPINLNISHLLKVYSKSRQVAAARQLVFEAEIFLNGSFGTNFAGQVLA